VKFVLDTTSSTITSVDESGEISQTDIYSQDGFKLLSEIWLKQQWNQMHWKSFSWFGFEIWQFPEDLLRLQEVMVTLKPDVIVETGVNRGGSAIYFATICRLLGKGRVISIDIHIPVEVRHSIEQSSYADLITLIEGDSTSPDVVNQVHSLVGSEEKVFVFLDSDHSKAHVLRELSFYSEMVTPGSYIVATDGVMESLTDTPFGQMGWGEDNPAAAAREFVASHPEFVIKRPAALFGEEYVIKELTYWPDAWLFRIAP
jgi:cephalosporin hydroxylase